MSEIKEIIVKILLLALDILLFTFQTVKQIILPYGRRKGNILSSLLNFFIGILERVIRFEHGFFRMTSIVKHKYCKQSLIILTALLFLISSFEWTGQPLSNNETESFSLNPHPSAAETNAVKKNRNKSYSAYARVGKPYSTKHTILYNYTFTPSSIKKYLFVQSFLI